MAVLTRAVKKISSHVTLSVFHSLYKDPDILAQNGVVISSFQSSKTPALAGLPGMGFDQGSDRPVIPGRQEAAPVFLVPVEPRGYRPYVKLLGPFQAFFYPRNEILPTGAIGLE